MNRRSGIAVDVGRIPVENKVAGVHDIGLLEVDDGIAVGVRGLEAEGADRIAVQMKGDAVAEGDGRQRAGNPNIRYDYYSLTLTARQRIMDTMWFGFKVKRTDRTDKYVGYYDYTRDSFGFEFHWAPGNRFDLGLDGRYSIFDYPNAFAFHEPLAGARTQEVADVGLIGSYRMTPHLTLVGEARYHETVSNDTRIQYERNQYTLGVRWER